MYVLCTCVELGLMELVFGDVYAQLLAAALALSRLFLPVPGLTPPLLLVLELIIEATSKIMHTPKHLRMTT